MSYDKTVFINCPFDKDYGDIQAYIVFTILYLGFEPLIASAVTDSGEARFSKITRMIADARFSIHDISRLKASRKGEYYRLNMPLELGVDLGIREFSESHKDKVFLILSREPYDYQKAASDLSGYDIEAHEDNAELCCEKVRNWLENHVPNKSDGASKIATAFTDFQSDLIAMLLDRGFNDKQIENLQMSETISEMKEWLQARSARTPSNG